MGRRFNPDRAHQVENRSSLDSCYYTAMASIKDVKAFWDERPCNIRHSQLEIGTKDYFDQVEERKYFVEPHIPKFAEFEKYRGKKVLEIGCGIGTDAVNFARAGAFYTGIEISIESLKISEQRFRVYSLRGEFLEGNVETIAESLSNRTFDLIYSFGVLHHTPNILNALVQIRTLCHKRTEFKFMVYAKNSWKSALIEIDLDQPEAKFGCPIANVYSKEEIYKLMSISGFKCLEIGQRHIFPYKVDKYVKYEYEKEEWFRVMPKSMFSKLEKVLGWHLLVKAVPA